MVIIPIPHSRSEDIGDALIEHKCSNYSIPEWMIKDQDSAFMFTLIYYLFKNHQSLQSEHGIKSLATILVKHLTELGQY